MLMGYKRLRSASLLVASAGAVALVIAIAFARGGGASPTPPPPGVPAFADTASAPAPVFRNQFVNDAGQFWVYPYDNREGLSAEQRANNPVVNPAWEPFASCMEGAGVGVRSQAGAAFAQSDLDRLLANLNREYPDTAANRRIPVHATTEVSGNGKAFIDCANQWLTKSAQEIYEITGKPNAYYPVPTVIPIK
jgi:hypothetical protein